MTLAATVKPSYAEVLHSLRFKKCLRHPDKHLVVQHDQASDQYVPWCVECWRERGDGRPVIGKTEETAERMWAMTETQLVKRDERIDALTVPIIRELLPVGKATENEVKAFILFCQAADANPFLKEAYLIKYQEGQPASIVLALQWYLKRASHCREYLSYQSGVIVKRDGAYYDIEGSAPYPTDELFGGWCRVLKKGAPQPFVRRVTMAEYDRHQAQWKTMPATMIEKVAIVQCVRRAFPDEFAAEEQTQLPVVIEGEVTEPPGHANVPLEKSTPSPSEPVSVVDTAEATTSAPVDFTTVVNGLPEVKTPQDLGKVARLLGYRPEEARAVVGPSAGVKDFAAAVAKLVEHSPLRPKEAKE